MHTDVVLSCVSCLLNKVKHVLRRNGVGKIWPTMLYCYLKRSLQCNQQIIEKNFNKSLNFNNFVSDKGLKESAIYKDMQ